MKLCPKCMEENDEAANFCTRCRAAFESAGKTVCPRGHIIDPTWTECPYCRLEQSAPDAGMPAEGAPLRKKTVVEGQQAFGMSENAAAPPPPPPPAPGFAGRPAAPPPASQSESSPHAPPVPPPPPPLQSASVGRRKTVFRPPSSPSEGHPEGARPDASSAQIPPAPQGATPARRILGVLVTYSWRPEGQVFAVREGRNLIGRGQECDICVPDDSALSNVNTHITYRNSFVIGDMVSMSGTDLNGRAIEEQFVPLSNYASIRTGSTHWIFITIDPPAQPSGQ